MSSPATVICFDTGNHYVFWCTFCQRWHFHGRENGHRVTHCHNRESPYANGGYILRCLGKATPEILRDIARRRPKGVTA